VRVIHGPPAFHDTTTVVGSEIMEAGGTAGGFEVTDQVFTSDASTVFHQPETRLHTIKAIRMASFGS
jgi:ornithine carbamoyltransferase